MAFLLLHNYTDFIERRKEVKNRKTSDSFGDIRKTYMYKKKKVASLCTYMVCFYGCRAFL